MKKDKIIIVMPVYNEGKGIRSQIEAVFDCLNSLQRKYCLIIIDDGSTDLTGDILSGYKTDENVILIRHRMNMGLGKALLCGLIKAQEVSNEGDVIITMESDSTNEIACLRKIIDCIDKGWDIVVCSRLREKGGLKGFPVCRRMTTVAVNKILKFIFPYKGLTDYSMIYRGYNAGLIKELFESHQNAPIKFFGFASTGELLLRLIFLKPGIEIIEIYDAFINEFYRCLSKVNERA